MAIVSHEVPGDETTYRWETNTDSTGTVFLMDADAIYDHVEDGEKVREPETENLEDLDQWTWLDSDHEAVEGEVDWQNFTLSPHNSDLSRHVVDDEEEFWLRQAHYHGGVRFLRLDTDTWQLVEDGWTRPSHDPPEPSKMEGLDEATPFVWAAVETNGITLASDINQGVHAVKHDRFDLRGGEPSQVRVTREDDGFLHVSTTTNRIDITAEYPDQKLRVRDRVPSGWTVAAGDGHTTYDRGGSTFVEFDETAAAGERTTFTYYARRPEGGTVSTVFGPVEVGDETHPVVTAGIEDDPAAANDPWTAVPGTIDRDTEVGAANVVSTGVRTGAAAGTIGLLAHQRDRITNAAIDLLGDGEE